jgi:methyl-accepting chemotaxis protein
MGMIGFKTLTGKLSIGSTVPFILVMAVAGFVSLVILEKEINREAERNLGNLVELAAGLAEKEVEVSIKNYLRATAEKNKDLLAFYQGKVEKGVLSREEALRRSREIFLDPDYGRIGATGYLAGVSSRGVLAIHPKSEGTDASGHDFMKQAMEMKNGYLEYEWKNPGEAQPRQKAGYLSYFAPWDIMVWASSYKSEFMELVDYSQLQKSFGSLRIGKEGFALLVKADGEILSGRGLFEERAGDKTEEILGLLKRTFETVEKGAVSYAIGRSPVNARFVKVRGMDWYAVVNDYSEEHLGIIKTFRIMVILAVLVAAVIIHLFIRLLMTKTLAPIRSIRAVTDSVSRGDLSKRIKDHSQDEIGELAVFFNQVVDAFEKLVYEMKSAVTVLLESTHSLGASTMEISSTANEQAASVKEILSTMEDSDTLSKGVAVKIQEVVKIANNTKENVGKGFTLIQGSLDKMTEIRGTNGNTIGGIKHLGGQIDSIWEIVNIINGIADQTKIIAFNAELEAAAAGDAGRNFQIVASEIRRLADDTVDSTNEIKAKINEIQHASDKLIIASEEGTQRIKEGWDISHHIRGVFEDVLSSSEISAVSADDISRSIRMQVSSFEQIFLTLKQISESIDSFVESTQSTTEASEKLKEIAHSFNSTVGNYTVKEEVEFDE